MDELRRAYQFHSKHSAYVVGEHAACALRLAKAEMLATNQGWRFVWEYDDQADYSFVDTWPTKNQKRWRKDDHCAEGCRLIDAEGKTLASLWSIIDASNEYKRTVEAELALEALAAWEPKEKGIW